MTINKEGLDLIKKFEGLRLNSYLDSVSIPTIGYGSTGPDIKLGMTWTLNQAINRLCRDLEYFEKGISDLLLVSVTENEFSALVCFAYNVGLGNLRKSTLLKLINSNKKTEAAKEFLKWNKAGGKVLDGLTKRRQAESELFLKQSSAELTLSEIEN